MNQLSLQSLTEPTTRLPPNPIRRNRRWLLLLLLLPMLACSLPGAVPQPPFHPTGQIVFECWPERKTSHLCLVNADGTGYHQLTDKASDRDPAWSPDGKHIVFARKVNEEGFPTVLFVMNIDNSSLIQLTNTSITAEYPSWAPTNDLIGFSYSKDEYRTRGIALVNVDGTELRVLTSSGEVAPKWLPNGKQIAFVRALPNVTKPDSRIYIMNIDGTDQTLLPVAVSGMPVWSPDGEKIALVIDQTNKFGIWTMNIDGSDLVRISDSGLSPSWSPDGQYIVFHRSDPACILCPNSGQLWIMRADGSQPTRITDGPVDQNPVWGPVP